ncbi:Uncharacterized protein GBIM_04156 [Gryllus bimaculatus]|nr:Uncharacterized protein GBIM_04156 [Gryllus bimaculatus]
MDVLSRIQAVTPINNARKFTVRFDMMCGNDDHYFDFIQGRKIGALRLIRPVIGPRTFQVKLQMVVLDSKRYLLAVHWAFVHIDVSPQSY